MTEPRKAKMSFADVVKQAAVMAASDPLGSFFLLLICGKYWKVTLILSGLVLTVGLIAGFVMLWTNRWDI
jgi:hypothetical protein